MYLVNHSYDTYTYKHVHIHKKQSNYFYLSFLKQMNYLIFILYLFECSLLTIQIHVNMQVLIN